MDSFTVNGYTAAAFTTALCEHKGWTGSRREKAGRIVDACDQWSREHGERAQWEDFDDSRKECERFVCGILGVSVWAIIFTIIRIVVAYYVNWYFGNYTACRASQW